jgi:hypothetical protein
VKNPDFTPKNHIFPNFKGAPPPPPGSAPVKDIKPSKAMGPDQIPNIVLKTCAKTLAPGMTKILQKSIEYGELPDDWLNANVAPVYKKGDVHKAENYRPGPVSLTSVTCKLL